MKAHKIEAVHQILILDKESGKLPDFVKNNRQAIKKIYPKAKYRLWNDRTIRKFLKKNFPTSVFEAYETLCPYAYKADLVKYALLYVYGGLCVDIGVLLLKPWNIPFSKDVAAFKEPSFISPSWSAIQTGLLWALPRREEFRLAIDLIVENCRKKYYGFNPLYPTGPVLLGKVFLSVMASRKDTLEADSQYVSQTRCVTAEADIINMTYVSREGIVVAIRNKKTGGDLKEIGLKNSNNYNEFWHTRQVYAENPMIWNSDDPLIFVKGGLSKTESGQIISLDRKEGMTYGPYVSLPKGRYRFSIVFEEESFFDEIKLSIVSNYSEIDHHSIVFSCDELVSNVFSYTFDVEELWRKVEFKIYTPNGFLGGIKKILIENQERSFPPLPGERGVSSGLLGGFLKFVRGI
ncbi:hypothetical protein GM608_03970 [Bombella sp. ESL0380]|uniref:glycosyltransferase family 32 protein n=1 Tax=Bombella TaxID=1654741 RepID=UPI00139EF515|nr:glycosyltransferase [Bombella apis]MCT6819155.1 hypothetical protein [Bombella apis]MUG79383.1 hypothetical protein [Bombella sp. ESL0380]